jgi:hypothetical protein
MHLETNLRSWLQRFLQRRMRRGRRRTGITMTGAFGNGLCLFNCYLPSQVKGKSWPPPANPFKWLLWKPLCLLSNRLVLRQLSRERR